MNYDHGDVLCDIIDVFENFLDSKGVSIKNEEKNGYPDEAIIYGTDYDSIKNSLDNLFNCYGLAVLERCEFNGVLHDIPRAWTRISNDANILNYHNDGEIFRLIAEPNIFKIISPDGEVRYRDIGRTEKIIDLHGNKVPNGSLLAHKLADKYFPTRMPYTIGNHDVVFISSTVDKNISSIYVYGGTSGDENKSVDKYFDLNTTWDEFEKQCESTNFDIG